MASDLEESVRAALRDKLQMMKIPEREEDFLPSACCLLEKQRELAEVEKALLAQKEEFQLKMEELQQRRKELELKEGQLKKSILKFDKFLKDNDAKRSRALRKANEEKQQAAQRVVEADRLKEEIAHLLAVKEKLQRQLQRHKVFPEYLQKVLEKTEQTFLALPGECCELYQMLQHILQDAFSMFQSIPELIARFQALMATQATLAQRELFGREAVEEERACLQHYMEESSNQILQQNNRVAELQAQLEQAQARVLELESSWVCIQNTAADKTLELGRIKLAALNLFQMVAKHRKLPVDVDKEDTAAQLDAVELCIVDLNDILANFRKGESAPVPQPEPKAASRSETDLSQPLRPSASLHSK